MAGSLTEITLPAVGTALQVSDAAGRGRFDTAASPDGREGRDIDNAKAEPGDWLSDIVSESSPESERAETAG